VLHRLVEVGALEQVEAGQDLLVSAYGPSLVTTSPRSCRTVVAVVVGYNAAPPRITAATDWPKAPYSAIVCRFSSLSSALQSGSAGS
jgi:hypothetical protein